MESILTSLQNIPKPSFLRTNSHNTQSEQKQPATSTKNDQNTVLRRNATATSAIETNPIQKLNNLPSALKKSENNLPAISFTDFGEWDLMPYNALFIRERLRRRIEANKSQYAEHGIIPQSIPLKQEIKSIKDILISGGTLSELRMSARSHNLSVILSYSKSEARPVTKPISQLSDTQLSTIIAKYNHLRRTTLINQPCLLCGIYDLYFLQFMLSIIKHVNIKLIEQKLMQFLTKSLIYCLIAKHREKTMTAGLNIDVIRDTTLDLLNYEAIHTLLLCISRYCDICYHCRVKYKLYKVNQKKQQNDRWFSELMGILINHGLKVNKVIKNASLKHETALMNIYNCQWLDLQQIIMINIPFQPFQGNKEVYVNKWCEFGENLLCQKENMRNNKKEYDKFSLEIQLTVFESFLKAVIEHKYLYKMIDFLYDKLKKDQSSWNEYDILITLLFCGHYKGYEYMFTLLRSTNQNDNIEDDKTLFVTKDYLNIFAIFESFDVLLSVTNVISSNLKDIGKIIAVRSCLFHYKFSKQYREDVDEGLMSEYRGEFVECLKILFYDYGLYDFDADAIHKESNRNTRHKYKKKLPEPVIMDNDEEKAKEMEANEQDIKDNEHHKETEEHEIDYVEMISMGLKSQKKFLMECAYLDVNILRCLMELQLVDEIFIVDRFRNTYDFVEYEMNFNVSEIWNVLQKEVFLYNKNVCLFRRMKRKELRLLFRRMIRVLVSIEYRQWIKEFIDNGDKSGDKAFTMDKNIQIQKRSDIEDKYKLPEQTMLLIQEYV